MDNSALLNRASLSQSRGLQNRRLPSNVAGKVPADYASRRRTRMYTGMSSGDELDDDGNTDEVSHELTAEERRQMVSGSVGVKSPSSYIVLGVPPPGKGWVVLFLIPVLYLD